ncbi:MAG: N-acetylglucosamine kinase [Tannerellaceae bacterium]|nr:N-acetylglucosamine kinase [Tannerellaceae bacterium]
MILIADSGSTKTSWCLIDKEDILAEFSTEGYNPCYITKDYLTDSLKEKLPAGYNWSKVTEIAFYGAGCYEDKFPIIKGAIKPLFPETKVEVAMDLTGSARSLLGNNAGFAAILGTGANSCLYDGRKITRNIDSLGFILGDEGSGGYMGKRIISDYIRGYMPEELRNSFWNTYQLTGDDLIDRIYTGDLPNRYCADFTHFITGVNKGHEYLDSVVRDSFRDFFESIVCGYPNYANYTFNCVGTIGWIFRKELSEVASGFGMKTGTIICNPMEGLIRYHRNNCK